MQVEVTVKRHQNLEEALGSIFDAADSAGVPKEVQEELHVIIDELVSNNLNYGSSGEVRLAIKFESSSIELEISDRNQPFDPLGKAPPDLSAHVEDREIGGMGIFLVKSLTDKQKYKREDNYNILTITKTF